MTHPNVEYFKAREELCIETNNKIRAQLTAAINNTTDEALIRMCETARNRLTLTEEFMRTLMRRIEDYEERIALLS